MRILSSSSSEKDVIALVNAGMSSAVMLSNLLESAKTVYPIFIRPEPKSAFSTVKVENNIVYALGPLAELDLADVEYAFLGRYLAAIRNPHLGRLRTIISAQLAKRNWRIEELVSFLNTQEDLVLGESKYEIALPSVLDNQLQILSRAKHLPLKHTFSCQSPALGLNREIIHCGNCFKCIRRKNFFEQAGRADLTIYAYPIGRDISSGQVAAS